jgi:chaperonin GroES
MSFNYQKLIPLNDRVIIEPTVGPEKIGGIIIPEQARTKSTQGIVVAVGPGLVSEQGTLIGMHVRIPLTVKVGDEVVFNEYTASKISVDGHDLCMIHESEINCIVKK